MALVVFDSRTKLVVVFAFGLNTKTELKVFGRFFSYMVHGIEQSLSYLKASHLELSIFLYLL